MDSSQRSGRRDLLKIAGGGLLGAVTTQSLGAVAARADSGPGGRLVGSWIVNVAFKYGPDAGKTAVTQITFIAGGGLVETDPRDGRAHAGSWARTGADQYVYTLAELIYDPSTTHISQVVRPHVFFKLSSDGNQLTSTSDETVVCSYDPVSGKLLNTLTLPNITVVTGTRITTGYTPPSSFPV